VVVSSCYSGGFVEPLASPRNLIITASAADRKSFGCSNDAELTDFGRAYFDEALRSANSFEAAFAAAEEAIARREVEKKRTPSQPRLHVGPAISEHLRRFVERISRDRQLPASG
jgi:hypothetical protein